MTVPGGAASARRAALGMSLGPRRRVWLACPLLLSLAVAIPAQAGHEIPFYPAFYPQEITVLSAAPETALRLFEKKTLHAYVGPDPFKGVTPPAHVDRVESLDGYVVLTLNRDAAGLTDPGARCAAAGRTLRALARAKGDWVVHPYPVTPFHADFVDHFDLAEAARKKLRPVDGDTGATTMRVRASGRTADLVRSAGLRAADGTWDASFEEVPLRTLLAGQESRVNGRPWPPWVKTGWFHAYLLHAGERRPASSTIQDAFNRRLRGEWASDGERVALERRIVSQAGGECDRVVAGYTVRSEAVNGDYSEGVENVAVDSQAGLDSAIFVRTVKLKDFPWNGWLTLGADGRPAMAWNPVDGFKDSVGRLVWSAIADPALLPSPRGVGWMPNRVRPVETATGTIEVPQDAVRPDPATGMLRPVGAGVTARAKVVYRVAASAFHDGTKMTVADVVYPFAFTSASGRRASTDQRGPTVERASDLQKEWLAAIRVVRQETEIKDLGEVQLFYDVPVVEVYLARSGTDSELAAAAPPWSTVPWQLLALMDEAVSRGLAAYSEPEARRRGVPWLDLARDRKLRDAMSVLAERFERQAWIPDSLKGLVTVEQARQRWAALRRFNLKHGHFLVTNGPYRLERFTQDRVVLGVFRDLSYPLGVGAFDRYAIPLRAFVTGVERQGERLALQAEVERVERAGRGFKIVRAPYRPEGEKRDAAPTAHYVVIGSGGEVGTAGVSHETDGPRLVVDLRGRLQPGDYRVMVALAVDDNLVNPEVKVIPYRVGD